MKSKMTFWRKSVKPLTAAMGLAVLLMSIQPVWAKVVDRVVATVNGVIITLSTVQERTDILKQQLKASGNSLELTEKKIIEETLNSLIEEKLQLQEAKRAGLEVDEEAVQTALKDILSKNNMLQRNLESSSGTIFRPSGFGWHATLDLWETGDAKP